MKLTTIRRAITILALPLAFSAAVAVFSPASPAQAATLTPLEQQVLNATNAARAKAGCAAVKVDGRLHYASRVHSADQAKMNTMTHTGSDKSDFATRVKRAGYSWPLSENVAKGYTNGATLVNAWLNSPTHRKNLLNCGAKSVGIGVATATNGAVYVTQDFGTV